MVMSMEEMREWQKRHLVAFEEAIRHLAEIINNRDLPYYLGEAGPDTRQAAMDAYVALRWLQEPIQFEVTRKYKQPYHRQIQPDESSEAH